MIGVYAFSIITRVTYAKIRGYCTIFYCPGDTWRRYISFALASYIDMQSSVSIAEAYFPFPAFPWIIPFFCIFPKSLLNLWGYIFSFHIKALSAYNIKSLDCQQIHNARF